MAIALKERRIIQVEEEFPRGTPSNPNQNDAIPLIRDPTTFEVEPVKIDRPTYRLSLTSYPDIYPGKSKGTITVAVEVHGRDTGFPTTPPHWTRLLRACAFAQEGEPGDPGTANIFAYKISAHPTNNGPLRHGETITGTAIAGTGNRAFGDSWSQDGGIFTTIFINEGATPGGGVGSLIGGTSATEFTATSKSAAKVMGWSPQSDVNSQATVTMDILADGKALRMKGVAGNVEFQFNYGDAAVANFVMQGIIQSGGYVDLGLPSAPFEGHKVPPTFLGTRVSLGSPQNVQSAPERYGTGGSASLGLEGALSQMRISSGNTVVIQDNALDPDGAQFGFISERNPVGSFDPTEVTEAEFSFMSRFVSGAPARMHVLLGATSHTDPSSQDQNTFEWLCPGIVFTGLADVDRDGINVFDGSFALTGGDYDSTAQGESIGQDNELVFLHR